MCASASASASFVVFVGWAGLLHWEMPWDGLGTLKDDDDNVDDDDDAAATVAAAVAADDGFIVVVADATKTYKLYGCGRSWTWATRCFVIILMRYLWRRRKQKQQQ